MVTFRIIENDRSYKELYKNFVKYYNKGLTYNQMSKKLETNASRLCKLKKEAEEKGDIIPRGGGRRKKYNESFITKIKENLQLTMYEYDYIKEEEIDKTIQKILYSISDEDLEASDFNMLCFEVKKQLMGLI